MIFLLTSAAISSFIVLTILQSRTAASPRWLKVWKVVHFFFTVIVFYVVVFTHPGFSFMEVFYCVLAWGAVTDIRFTLMCVCGGIAAAIFQSLCGG